MKKKEEEDLLGIDRNGEEEDENSIKKGEENKEKKEEVNNKNENDDKDDENENIVNCDENDLNDIKIKKDKNLKYVFPILIVSLICVVIVLLFIIFIAQTKSIELQANPNDVSSYSNFDKIKQQDINLDLFLDVDKKTLNGTASFIFEIIDENENKIILDNFDVIINEVILVNTNKKLKFKIFDENEDKDSLGTPVIINLPQKFKKNDKITVKIDFTTLEKSRGIQYLTKEQTKNKKYPFVFTQGEAILVRSLFPCQDTPSAKVTISVKARIKKPLTFLFSGIQMSNSTIGDYNLFEYKQTIPIPTYLIAFAAGELEFGQISERCGVWTEIGLKDQAVNEFQLCEKYLKTAEDYLSTYLWSKYNILVLPFSFPYGGMENPSLTFVSPSILAGDRSMANVITHEISHSWTGNLVTNKNWGNFWINEGFTTFMERKILEIINGKEYGNLLAYLGKNELYSDMKIFGENHEFTKLEPDYSHINPDDGFSSVPYEKGFQFLYYIKELINETNFQSVFREYIEEYKYESVDYTAFKEVLEKFVKKHYKQKEADEILKKIDWEGWIYKPGKPLVELDFRCSYVTEGEEKAKDYLKGKYDKENDLELFKGWDTRVKAIFLNYILVNIDKANDNIYKNIRDILELNGNYNAEVKYIWYQICLKKKDDTCIDYVKDFLKTNGRMKYIKPIYMGWYSFNKNDAREFFEKNKFLYHPVAQTMIKETFKIHS